MSHKREVLDRYAVTHPRRTWVELTVEERAPWAPRPFEDDMSDEAERRRIKARRKRAEEEEFRALQGVRKGA